MSKTEGKPLRQQVAVAPRRGTDDCNSVFSRLHDARSAARASNRGKPASSRRLAGRGLQRVTVLVPVGCAEIFLLLAGELRARQSERTTSVTLGWRRLSPSAELFVDLESGARCTIRDTGAPALARYLWTVSAFGEHQLAVGRAGELAEARAQAEMVVAAYMAARCESRGRQNDAGVTQRPSLSKPS